MASPAWELFVMGPHYRQLRSYVRNPVGVKRLVMRALLTMFCLILPVDELIAAERPVSIVVLGDSLSAGFGLSVENAFPAKLAGTLKANAIAASIINAGVSGDTASGRSEEHTSELQSHVNLV